MTKCKRYSKRILLGLLLVAGTALAGRDQESDAIPFGRMQRLNATEFAEKGPNGEPSEATDAFNYLQDQLGKPHVKGVTYDPDADRFRWRGPVSGRKMSMSREKFWEEICLPYANSR
jgi:hypothetical protein